MPVFLVDVDNTLLDNDQIERDLRGYLDRNFGTELDQRYWTIFEQLRNELGYADYVGAVQRLRIDYPRDDRIPQMALYLIDYPFAERLYPGALETLGRLQDRGPTVILSDGDAAFQPHKISRSGIWETVEGKVLIYVHKEQMLDDVEHKYPSEHYVIIDDKLRILAAMKQVWGSRLTTLWVKQGHYAADTKSNAQYPPADVTVQTIADVCDVPLPQLLGRPSG